MSIFATLLRNWKLLFTVEGLALLVSILAAGVFGIWVYDQLATPVVLHDVGASFANDLRQIEALSRERNEYIRVQANPDSPQHPAKYLVFGEHAQIAERVLPKGMSIAGFLRLNTQGVPLAPGSFILRKGKQHLTVIVDETGQVSVSSSP